MAMPESASPNRSVITPTVRTLGLVSLLTDVSSEMVYPINPMYITGVLGAPVWTVGMIEGAAESVASLLKLTSGWLSDRVGRRKPFTVAGYGLGALAKPLMALSTVWGQVLGSRLLDRTGKGLRTAPRDALITENCSPDARGRAFGFHRSMDTSGAVAGPLAGWLFLRCLHMGKSGFPPLATVYWFAFIPGVLAVLLLVLCIRERPKRDAEPVPVRPTPPSWKTLSPAYRRYLMIVGLFSIGNSSDAFLLLRARDAAGFTPETALLLYALFNLVEALFGYSAGKLSDRVGRPYLISAGYLVFGLVYGGFAVAHNATAIWFLFTFYGLYYTLTQGSQRALAADLAHPDRRGAEIGAFHMIVGIAAFPASLCAGWLYEQVGASTPFMVGAITSVAAALLMLNESRTYNHQPTKL